MDDADEALALRARSGEREAFASLVRRHQDRVFGFLLRMLGNREDAMDLTQDAFLKAWNALPGWRPEARFTTWLFQIARNAALDLLRRRGSLQFVSLDDPPQQGDAQDPRDAGPLPEERLADRQRIDLLQRALAALPGGVPRNPAAAGTGEHELHGDRRDARHPGRYRQVPPCPGARRRARQLSPPRRKESR